MTVSFYCYFEVTVLGRWLQHTYTVAIITAIFSFLISDHADKSGFNIFYCLCNITEILERNCGKNLIKTHYVLKKRISPIYIWISLFHKILRRMCYHLNISKKNWNVSEERRSIKWNIAEAKTQCYWWLSLFVVFVWIMCGLVKQGRWINWKRESGWCR